MKKRHQYFVYILTRRSGTLYIGVTNSLESRLLQHRDAPLSTFTGRYRIHRLMYFEEFGDTRTGPACENERPCGKRRKT